MKMPFVWLVLAALVFFGLYSVAPIFGLDALWPELFASDSTIGWVILVVLMLLGGLYWRGFWIKSQKRQGRRND
jgi:drug/metabolite transporter (DMT)-like permease